MSDPIQAIAPGGGRILGRMPDFRRLCHIGRGKQRGSVVEVEDLFETAVSRHRIRGPIAFTPHTPVLARSGPAGWGVGKYLLR